MGQAPHDARGIEYKVVCDKHGTVAGGVDDWIAASLVTEEHQQGCSAAVTWHPEGRWFTRASELGPEG